MARRSSTTTRIATAPSARSASTRCSSSGSGASTDSEFSTQIVDVRRGQLFDVVPGRSRQESRSRGWPRSRRPGGTRSPTRRSTSPVPIGRCSTRCCPTPPRWPIRFHVVKLANSKLDECRRRVQNETMGHRGRKTDPLYRCRRLLTKADERLEENGRDQAPRPLARGGPEGRGDDGLARERGSARALRAHRRRRSPSRGSSASPPTWPTRTTRSRSARSDGRCVAGSTRSPRGTEPRSPTDRPRQPTT